MRHLYILTDGAEIYKVAAMTPDEWKTARREAASATGGNVNWDLANNLPVADGADVRVGHRSV